MDFSFAYSFDRESFRSKHPTRQDALREGLDQARHLDNTPEMVYVGKLVPVEPGSSGLAEMILGAMRRRLRESVGDSATQPLLRVNEHQLAELDDAIDRVIRQWLDKHNLTPTQSKIIAISEHPVPQPAMTPSNNGATEVTDLGETSVSLW